MLNGRTRLLERRKPLGTPLFLRIKEALAGVQVVWRLAIFSCVCAGCNPQTEHSKQAPGPALYGAPAGEASKSIPRARPNSTNQEWTNAPFAFVQTELSPATLFHCASNQISFFSHLTNYGLGAPNHI